MPKKKCFLSYCSNSSITHPDKVFVLLRESMKKEWGIRANVKIFPHIRTYCCEDHLKPEDYKVPKYGPKTGDPVLNHTATFPDFKIIRAESSELRRILTYGQPLVVNKQRGDDEKPISRIKKYIDIGVQCSPQTKNQSTNFKAGATKTNTVPRLEVFSPIYSTSSTDYVNSSPSVKGSSSEIESTQERKSDTKPPIIDLVYKNPKVYLGLPKQYIWILEHIIKESNTNVTVLKLIVTLLKLKQNDTFLRIGLELNLSLNVVSKMFSEGLVVLRCFFQNFIFIPSKFLIKLNLPSSFKINYSHVTIIIDCFEIEIQKPSNPMKQAQTWSSYKSCNTVKYLIGCVPDGLIAYVSKGFGGRISDKAIIEKSDFLDILPENAVVLADRGFKEVEAILSIKNAKLLRPPSVFAATKPTKDDVLKSKTIASLRVHIERVIRRVREFRSLTPHANVTPSFCSHLDSMVLVACGLINLQPEIIKRS